MKRNIKSELKEMYHSIPNKNKDDALIVINDRLHKSEYYIQSDMSLFSFIKSQIRFISVKTWLCQLFIILLYGVFVTVFLRNIQGFLILVPAAPIVVLIGTSELSRSYRYCMTEIEFPTHFSLRRLLLARLCLMAVSDIFTFTCLIIFTLWHKYEMIGYLILYAAVPFVLAAFGSLFIMNRFKNASSRYYTAIYCIFLSVFGSFSINNLPMWYDTSARIVWYFIFFISIAGLITEIYKMWHDCSNMETLRGIS